MKASGIVAAASYIVCALAVAIAPGLTSRFFSFVFHIDLTGLSRTVTWVSFFAGMLLFSVGVSIFRWADGLELQPAKGGIMRSKLWLNAIVVALAIVVACARKEPAPAAASGEPAATPAASAEKTYPFRGKVVSIDPARNQITVDHERVEGLWEPMSMAFEVRGSEPGSLPPQGSTIRATLHVENGRYWLTDIMPE